MKNDECLKHRRYIFALLSLLMIRSNHSFGGADQFDSTGTVMHRWPANSTISYTVNPDSVAGFTTDLQKLVVVGAVDDAFRAWTGIPGASIHFSNDGLTELSGTSLDGSNVISFQDASRPLPPGVLAQTVITSANNIGTVQLPNGRLVNVQFAGQIVDADIFFSSKITINPIGMSGADLVSILTHEVGHLLGLDHTGVLSSIMDPFGESGTVSASRLVQSDDTITAASLYPDASFSPLPGAILGIVTNTAGTAVKSADVIAVSVPGGVPVAAQLSGADGKYTVSGLPAGNYNIIVEPLDGPITLNNFPGFYQSGQANFATTVLGGASSPTVVSVANGQTLSANVTVATAPSNLLNGSLMSSALQSQTTGTLTFSVSPLYLPRGKAYTVFLSGSSGAGTSTLGVDTSFSFSAPSSDITVQGATSGTSFRQQNISVSATAAIGPTNLTVSNTTSRSIMPGAIVVTVNPSVNASLDGAGFGRTLAPGAIFSIFGTDLAFGRGASGTESAAATPLPTSMGGVSVKVGDRFAPLFFVSPNQINAMVPFETIGVSADVTVVTGPLAAGNTTTITLSPSSPGIFSTNSSGAGQGAILNGADNSFAAPSGSIPGAAAHSARPGDVIVIFASGLGAVSPALPSGVAAGANGTPIPTLANSPQVKIGGQNVPAANIQFAGLAPGFVGLYQVNVQLPTNTATGNAVPVQFVTAQGQSSNTVTIAVNP